jgi:hypothetical protein
MPAESVPLNQERESDLEVARSRLPLTSHCPEPRPMATPRPIKQRKVILPHFLKRNQTDLTQVFLPGALLTILYRDVHAVHCRMFSGISRLYLLDDSSTLSTCDKKKP